MYIFEDLSLPFEARAAALVSMLTLEEKAAQLSNTAPAIKRLGIRAWQWWNEASHGVCQVFQPVKDATSFPTCLAMSQSWDPVLIEEITTAISDEIRAYYNLTGKELDYWCPTVNMGRDPRWGRNDESFGEDPYLAGKLAAAYVRGLQGKDSTYLKSISTPKHFAANNSEYNRCRGTSNMDEATLREYYLPVFERCIREGGAYSIMTSYNRVNGVPSSVNTHLLRDILREEWGFKGYIVSDDGAVGDVGPNTGLMFGELRGQFYGKTMEEASGLCVNAGTDLCTGIEHEVYLLDAVRQGVTTEMALDRALIRAFTARMKLGTFDDPKTVPFYSIGTESICSEQNAALARKAAEESLVLLRNENKILPLNESKIKKLAVIGPNALYRQLGSYSIGGNPKTDSDTRVCVTPLEGIRAEASKRDIEVQFAKGWNYAEHRGFGFGFGGARTYSEVVKHEAKEAGLSPEDYLKGRAPEKVRAIMQERFAQFAAHRNDPEIGLRFPVDDPDLGRSADESFTDALKAAADADAVVVVVGTDPSVTREGRDRDTLSLPYDQDEKVRMILEVNPNVIAVCISVGPTTGDFLDQVPGLLNAIYAGESQGSAIADVLFGKVNPSGRTTETWFYKDSDLPHISEYGIRPFDTATEMGRTYLYYLGKARFPFGYGLSYTSFKYSSFRLDKAAYDANETITASINVTNTGDRAGAEVAELYIHKTNKYDNKPYKQLIGFDKIHLEPGETQTVTIKVPISELKFWNSWKEKYEVEEGDYLVWFGADSDNVASEKKEIKLSGCWNAPLSAITILMDRSILRFGEETDVTLAATLEDATHLDTKELPIVVRSSDPSVALYVNGRVRAVSAGAVTLTAEFTLSGITKHDTVGLCVL